MDCFSYTHMHRKYLLSLKGNRFCNTGIQAIPSTQDVATEPSDSVPAQGHCATQIMGSGSGTLTRHTHTNTHTQRHTQTHTQRHTHTKTHTHTQTHTHTHTHTDRKRVG